MRISMPSKFTTETINIVMAINSMNPAISIFEIYGSVPGIVWGSGRAYETLPQMQLETICEHIRKARNKHLHFNYVMNSICYSNDEYDKDKIHFLLRVFDELVDAGVDVITLANPYLIRLFSQRYPDVIINASAVLHITTLQTAKFYESMGAKRITLHSDINRDINKLKEIKEGLSVDVEILANPRCLMNCPMEQYHYCVLGHNSGERKLDNWFNFCTVNCTLSRLKKPMEIFRSGWIRPQDIYRYEDINIDILKVVGREFELPAIYKISKLYACKDIVTDFGPLLGGFSNVELPSGKVKPSSMYIDGTKDDLYEKRFHSAAACISGCGNCTVCSDMAENCLEMYEKENFIQKFKNLQDDNFCMVNI